MKKLKPKWIALLLATLAMPLFSIAGCALNPWFEDPELQAPALARTIRIVTIDINPSIVLTVDEETRTVLEAEALNPEGQELLDEVPVEGQPVEDAVGDLVDEAVDQGYIDPEDAGDAVAIGVSDPMTEEEPPAEEPPAEEPPAEEPPAEEPPAEEPPAEEPPADETGDDLADDLGDAAEEALEEAGADPDVEVCVSEIAHERIAAARELGISPGRLLLIDRLAGLSDMTREEALALYKEAKVRVIMKETNRLRKEAKVGQGDDGEEPGEEPEEEPGDEPEEEPEEDPDVEEPGEEPGDEPEEGDEAEGDETEEGDESDEGDMDVTEEDEGFVSPEASEELHGKTVGQARSQAARAAAAARKALKQKNR